MGFEVEIKFRATDLEALERRLRAIGAEAGDVVEQEDVYLSHPSRDFAVSGEAFRVRSEGASNRLTYKGPKHSGPTKTREEVEIGFEQGEEAHRGMLRVFEALGFRRVASVRKVRRPFRLVRGGRPMEVVLDRIEGLGTFAEVETLAGSGDLADAQAAVQLLARELGLDRVEPRSYLRMLLETRGGSA
jgi:adenylate cyclase, class 2